MSEPTLNETRAPNGAAADERDRERRRPSLRNRTIYERRVLGGETLAALATEYNVTHQRIAQIATRVEGWIAGHPEDQLANRLRLRCRLRYEALYESAVTGFADSRKEEVTVKQRKTTRAAKRGSPDVVLGSAEVRSSAERKATEERPSAERKATMADEDREDAKPEEVVTVEERIVRQRHGDPRLLATAMKAVEKLERFAASLDREKAWIGSRDSRGREAEPKREIEMKWRAAAHAKPRRREEGAAGQRSDEPRESGSDSGRTPDVVGIKVSTTDNAVDTDGTARETAASTQALGSTSPATLHSPLTTSPGVGDQDSGVGEETAQQSAGANPTASSPATLHSPLTTPDPGVGIQGSGVGEETPQGNEANATASSLATLHSPLTAPSLPAAGCLLPTPPATRPKHVLIVGHYKQIDRMSSLAQGHLPGFEITAACQAWVAKEWIKKHVHEAALIWLENDLGPRREEPGGTINPGTGREVAIQLAEARPRCRVLVNEGDDHHRPLYTLLDDAACSVKEVFHEGGDWLRDTWLPALRRALRLRDEEGDFYFEDEDDDDEYDFA